MPVRAECQGPLTGPDSGVDGHTSIGPRSTQWLGDLSKGLGKGEHKRGLAPPLFFALRLFPLGAQEQTVEVVLGDALIGAAVLEEEIG